MEITNDMALTVRNESRAISVPTAEQLRRQLANAKEELSKAINNADLKQMTALRQEIKALPEQIMIAEIHELKNRLKMIEIERQQNQEKIKDVMAVRKHKNLLYIEKVNELIPYKQDVDKWETKLGFAREEEVLLLQERREINSRLFLFSETLRDSE